MEVGSAQGTEQGVAENAAKTWVGVFHGEEGGISVEGEGGGEGGGSPWMMEREGDGGGEEGRCRCWRLESWSIRRVTPGIAAPGLDEQQRIEIQEQRGGDSEFIQIKWTNAQDAVMPKILRLKILMPKILMSKIPMQKILMQEMLMPKNSNAETPMHDRQV